MAKCNLVLDHPNFQIIGNAAEKDLNEGLEELRAKVARGHKISGFFSHPMKRFTQYHNQIWEWDFAPAGDKSRTRKGWRLFAYVPEWNGPEPVTATAFVAFDKNYAPAGNQETWIADALKEFLTRVIVRTVPEKFKRVTDTDGTIISHCIDCFERLESNDEGELDLLEDNHAQECTIPAE